MKRATSALVIMILAAAVAVAPASQQSLRRESERAFGFRAGEVRRYVLLDDARVAGARSEWAIRLNRVLGEEPNRAAAFWLEYRRHEPGAAANGEALRLVAWEQGEVVVNDAGFPLRFWFTRHGEQSLTSSNYAYDNGVYRKTLQDSYRQSRAEVPVAMLAGRSDAAQLESYMDLTNLSGFCLSPLTETGGAARWSDSLLGNPGLLTLMLPPSIPDDGSQWGVALFEPAGSVDRLRARRLALGSKARVQIGDRRPNAHRLDLEGIADEIYVDEDGVVLRAGDIVLLDPDDPPEALGADASTAASTRLSARSSTTTPPAGARRQRLFFDSSRTMFGYSVGEVRSYALGPEDELENDEAARWIMRLTRIVGEGDGRRAVFWLEYRRYRGSPIPFMGNQRLAAWEHAELIVNASGFPETLWTMQHAEDFFSTTLYSYANGGYRTVVQTADRQWQTENSLRGDDETLDLERLSGLNVYASGGASSPSNPGLLSLMIPHPLPASALAWETSLHSFLVPPSRSVPWYLDNMELSLGDEITELRLGDRTVPVRRLEFRRRFGNAYVDERGVVVRVDLNTPLFGLGERWIALIEPSEH